MYASVLARSTLFLFYFFGKFLYLTFNMRNPFFFNMRNPFWFIPTTIYVYIYVYHIQMERLISTSRFLRHILHPRCARIVSELTNLLDCNYLVPISHILRWSILLWAHNIIIFWCNDRMLKLSSLRCEFMFECKKFVPNIPEG